MRRAPSLHTHGRVSGVHGVQILKVLTRSEAEAGYWPSESILLWNEDADDHYAGSVSPQETASTGKITVHLKGEVVQPGDVVRLSESKSLVSVL